MLVQKIIIRGTELWSTEVDIQLDEDVNTGQTIF